MNQLTITYLGQCGFLLDFGDVRLVTDPYLSSYVDDHSRCAEVKWQRLYPAPTTLANLRPDAVIISHSHGDHMDPDTLKPYILSGGDALIIAPAPECEALSALGAKRIAGARSESTIDVGRARITPIPCAHTDFHLDAEGRYRELSYIVECGGFTAFFGGDMSLYDGLYERLLSAGCDLLLLPVNGRDAWRTQNGIVGNMDCREAANLAARLNVPFIPMHHDLYAINGCPVEEIRLAAHDAGARAIELKPMESKIMPSPSKPV